MKRIRLELKKSLISFWFVSVFAVFICLFFAVFQYRSAFNGPLATNSVEFANFGAYVGGIFGPLVSFVTLLAVLKTVYMQRELINAQNEQITLYEGESNRARVQAYQTALLNVIQGFVNEFRLDSNESLVAADKASSTEGSVLDSLRVEAEHRKNANEGRQKIAALTILALELSVSEFESVEELKEKFKPQMLKIFYPEDHPD
ncbi:hypothetical protein CBI55_03660 [Pseudomonas syringae]|uniref:hypothetical protein n=1 Tax=Pseudomonas syringae TaxID=317 RepID=UPI000C1CBEF2|nr:hypothetical protein [Pseudomonas syringae]PIO96032.1 hypothetical protein CBI55_03660 [Pseudomonas syringae]